MVDRFRFRPTELIHYWLIGLAASSAGVAQYTVGLSGSRSHIPEPKGTRCTKVTTG